MTAADEYGTYRGSLYEQVAAKKGSAIFFAEASEFPPPRPRPPNTHTHLLAPL